MPTEDRLLTGRTQNFLVRGLLFVVLVVLIVGLGSAMVRISGDAMYKDGQAIEYGGLFNISNYLPLSGGTLTGDLDLGGNTVLGVGGFEGDCPSGYVWVPGSEKYGTNPGFCVMKYEAKDDGSGNPVSQASGSPWVSITQYDARQECRSLGEEYHLISEREWMTIAENIMRQPSNWADGNIGSEAANGGGLYLGNVEPSGNHSHLGYDGDDPESGTNRPESASLNLSNGREIYDFSGNVWEWTDYYVISDGAGGGEMPQPGDSSWHDYTNISDFRGMRHARVLNPSWNSSQGIGRMYTEGDSASPSGTTHAVLRGSSSYTGADAGVLSVILEDAPSFAFSTIGFRCSY